MGSKSSFCPESSRMVKFFFTIILAHITIAQRSSVDSPVVVTAHEPASFKDITSEQDTLSNNSQNAALRLPTGPSENDVGIPASRPSNISLQVDVQEETDNKVADPRPNAASDSSQGLPSATPTAQQSPEQTIVPEKDVDIESQEATTNKVVPLGNDSDPQNVATDPPTTIIDSTEEIIETTTFNFDGNATLAAGEWAEEGASQPSHPCARECVAGAPPMRCSYRFEVEGYYTMSKACYDCPQRREDCDLMHCVAADGLPRGIIVVNRQMPGPAVEVCRGDQVIVDMHNGLVSESTTVHWHGQHQRGTPYMDGAPHVTQCPVPPMTTFRYNFTADTPGTHFWHSHSGHQRADGAFGAMVVRVPRSADPHAALWDRDERAHTLVVLDWGAAAGAERFLAHHHASGSNKPTALLINGRGRVLPAGAAPDLLPANSTMPAPEFRVKQGLRYRFRLINAGFLNCPVELSVDDHDILVIASDGGDIRPVPAASLVSYAGERFDFVLEANRSVGAYWIRMRGLLDCDERFTSVHQAAILRYEGATEEEPVGELSYAAAHRPGHQVNSLNVGSGTPGSTVIPELDALVQDDESLNEEPDLRVYVAYDFYALDNPHFHLAPYYGFYNVTKIEQRTYTPQFNHISMKIPSVPLLPQREQLDPRQFCNSSSVAELGCEQSFCECPHVIQVPLNAVLELVVIDEGVTYEANHPFHLHGYAFRVVAMQRLGSSTTLEEVKRLDAQGLIPRKLHAAPLKDTCTVPDGGFTIVRLRASNPGYWLLHCHIDFHVEIGMALVLKVGEHSDYPPVPKGFPRCGDWTPEDFRNETPSPPSSALRLVSSGTFLLVALLLLVPALTSISN